MIPVFLRRFLSNNPQCGLFSFQISAVLTICWNIGNTYWIGCCQPNVFTLASEKFIVLLDLTLAANCVVQFYFIPSKMRAYIWIVPDATHNMAVLWDRRCKCDFLEFSFFLKIQCFTHWSLLLFWTTRYASQFKVFYVLNHCATLFSRLRRQWLEPASWTSSRMVRKASLARILSRTDAISSWSRCMMQT